MPTLITTPGATNANAYVTVVAADTWNATVLHGEKWASTSQAKKEQAILLATRLFEYLIDWKGIPTSSGQALKWPRRGVITQISATGGGTLLNTQTVNIYGGIISPIGIELATDQIPQFLQDATAEFARVLLVSDRIEEQDSGNISSIEIPGLTVGYLGSGSSSKRKLIPPQVYEMIAFYVDTMMGYTPRRIIRS